MPLEAATPAPTINDMMADALSKTESGAASDTSASVTVPPGDTGQVAAPDTSAPQGETAEQAAQRARDEKGRFAKGEQQPAQAQQPAAPVVKARPPVPSTWKKEHRGHWDNIDPALAEYLVQRESEFASGVSTYAT